MEIKILSVLLAGVAVLSVPLLQDLTAAAFFVPVAIGLFFRKFDEV